MRFFTTKTVAGTIDYEDGLHGNEDGCHGDEDGRHADKGANLF